MQFGTWLLGPAVAPPPCPLPPPGHAPAPGVSSAAVEHVQEGLLGPAVAPPPWPLPPRLGRVPNPSRADKSNKTAEQSIHFASRTTTSWTFTKHKKQKQNIHFASRTTLGVVKVEKRKEITFVLLRVTRTQLVSGCPRMVSG